MTERPITARLRHGVDAYRGEHGPIRHEAADEIERLQWKLAEFGPEHDRLTAERQEADEAFKIHTLTALIAEWGGEYKSNINALDTIHEFFPSAALDRLFSGRTADGRLIGDDPTILRGFVEVARKLRDK